MHFRLKRRIPAGGETSGTGDHSFHSHQVLFLHNENGLNLEMAAWGTILLAGEYARTHVPYK